MCILYDKMSWREKKSFGLRKSFSFFLFIASFSPVFVYYWIVSYRDDRCTSWLCVIICLLPVVSLVSFIFVRLLLKSMENTCWLEKTIKNVKSIQLRNIECLNYMVTYVFSFLGAQFLTSVNNVLGVLWLWICIYIIYRSSNSIYMNPLFIYLKYSVHEIVYDDKGIEKSVFILSSMDTTIKLSERKEISALRIQDNFYFYK